MKPQVLLVDDVAFVRESLARMLSPRYDVSTAEDAPHALELLRARGGVPVVVSDQAMPGLTGLELLTRVHREWPETVGLLLTGETDPKLGAAAIQQGHVFRLLSKPCEFETLVGALDAALHRHAELDRRAGEEARRRFSLEATIGFNQMLEARVDRQTRALRKLTDLAVELNGAASLATIAKRAADAAHDLLDGRGVHVQLWDERGHVPGAEASSGREMSAHMWRGNVDSHGVVVGEITVDVERALRPADETLLESLTSSIAVAAHNELRRHDRDRAHHALIVALARLSEARDNETGRHLERVAAYCRLIAEGLRADGRAGEIVDDGWIADLVRASPLHDIGKVGIPDSILLKPGRLTPAEWEIMKTHAALGATTLDAVIADFGEHRLLAMGRAICASHHEKWDGSGYPNALAGTAIPLAARILALADVYDALTSARPYKHAWPHAEALEWIRTRAGQHFDPDVVKCFVAREAQADAIRGRLADASPAVVMTPDAAT